MPHGDPILSPWTWEATYPDGGPGIRITLLFDDTTRQLQDGGALQRDQDSIYSHIHVGLGPDGTPNTSPNTFSPPVGTTAVTAAQLNTRGLITIEDVLGQNITAS